MKLKYTNPTNPVYIISKGRAESMHTSRSLSRMKVPHYIAIEPQDEDDYKKALIHFNLLDFALLLILPFSNHGDGPGRARNWCWNHSMITKHKRFWVIDDNIDSFYRLHKNKRIRVESGAIFKAAEDFVDRFENVPVSGFQYRFFIAPNQKYPPYVINTRIYSCILIDISCRHKFRGRYNEDTILSLDVLKDGDCTIQFNAFLQGKLATQTLKGGNTEEFYHKEGSLDKSLWRDGQLNPQGTVNKSQMLYDLHPDVTKLVWRYGRVHHHVSYDKFKNNKLILKDSNMSLDKYNNYGMLLTNNYKG